MSMWNKSYTEKELLERVAYLESGISLGLRKEALLKGAFLSDLSDEISRECSQTPRKPVPVVPQFLCPFHAGGLPPADTRCPRCGAPAHLNGDSDPSVDDGEKTTDTQAI